MDICLNKKSGFHIRTLVIYRPLGIGRKVQEFHVHHCKIQGNPTLQLSRKTAIVERKGVKFGLRGQTNQCIQGTFDSYM